MLISHADSVIRVILSESSLCSMSLSSIKVTTLRNARMQDPTRKSSPENSFKYGLGAPELHSGASLSIRDATWDYIPSFSSWRVVQRRKIS